MEALTREKFEKLVEKDNRLISKLRSYGYAVAFDMNSNKNVVHRNGRVYGQYLLGGKIVRNELKGKLQDERSIIRIAKIVKTDNEDFPYNVQVLNSLDCGKSFYYTGSGKFFKTEDEAQEYKMQIEKDEGEKIMKNNFIDDEMKVKAMMELSKEGFLMSYREITEAQYENTKEQILIFVKAKKKLNKELNKNL